MEVVPPTTLVGFIVNELMLGTLTVSDTVLTAPLRPPVTVTVVVEVIGTVLILNVAVVAPAAIVTVAGTVAEALLELNITTAPPVGAAAPRVIVQTLGEPPTTEVGLSVKVSVLTDVIVRTAVELPTPD